MVDLLRLSIRRPTGRESSRRSPLRTPGKPNHDTFQPAILCKIARFLGEKDMGAVVRAGPNGFELQHESEQFRSAILSGLGHDEVEMSIPAFSFRSSELSQPI